MAASKSKEKPWPLPQCRSPCKQCTEAVANLQASPETSAVEPSLALSPLMEGALGAPWGSLQRPGGRTWVSGDPGTVGRQRRITRVPGGQAGSGPCPGQGLCRAGGGARPGSSLAVRAVINPAIQTERHVSKFLLLIARLTWKPALCLPLLASPQPLSKLLWGTDWGPPFRGDLRPCTGWHFPASSKRSRGPSSGHPCSPVPEG